ncbi:MAG: hypothetical protein H7245_01775 [Candidatus Saccharibacteria bacterium]|nr:hypothetical protein [Pseudorhodobacter sp.]
MNADPPSYDDAQPEQTRTMTETEAPLIPLDPETAAPDIVMPSEPDPAPTTDSDAVAQPAEPVLPISAPLAPQTGGVPGFAAQPARPFVRPAVVTMTAHLRNAREPYETRLGVEGLTDIWLDSDTSSGLTYQADGTLSGTPATAGDFTLQFIGKLNGMTCNLTVHLAVIPDPKSL